MNTILLTIAYDGTRYSGWQRQLNGVSVQEELERALSFLYNEKVTVTGASRTDAGVHAIGQRASFCIAANPYPISKLAHIINVKLPRDITIYEAQTVPHSFNPRFMAKQKTYEYTIHNAPFENPLKRTLAWHIWQPLDIGLMKAAATHIVGKHDFACFRASGGHAKTSIRTIFNMDINKHGNEIIITITGDGFLYKMVRNIVGTLVYVGMNKLTVASIPQIINSRNRTMAGKTAPAHGLTLIEVQYNESDLSR